MYSLSLVILHLSDPDGCSYKTGTKAAQQYQILSGCSNQAPPLELTGGDGTACIHWDETCFKDEQMTSVSTGNQPISAMSIATLDDLGYQVNYGAADTFTPDMMDSSCRCNVRRELGEEEERPRRRRAQLSKEGEAAAREYGVQELLKERNAWRASSASKDPSSDIVFLGDHFVSVIYMENGNLFTVEVFGDDLPN